MAGMGLGRKEKEGVPAPPSSFRHVTSIPSVSSPEVSLLPMPPPAWNTPAGFCQN